MPEMEQKNDKKFLVLKLILFESGTTNSHNPQLHICHWQSMCYEAPVRFALSLKDIFYKSGSLRAMKKYDESALMQILQEFPTV